MGGKRLQSRSWQQPLTGLLGDNIKQQLGGRLQLGEAERLQLVQA
ncbi:MAG: hypothetical protein QXF21_04495 [Thermoproteota archaeon]